MADDALYKVAYDEAVRVLAEQQSTIDRIRSRAGLLSSSAAVMTSLLAAEALRGGEASLFSWLGLASFVGAVMALLAILWPRGWDVSVNPHEVIRTYIEAGEPASIGELHRELSFHMHGSYRENSAGLKKLVVFFQIANVLVAVELVLWVVAIAFAS